LFDAITSQGVDEDWFTFNTALLHKYQVTLYRASNTDIRCDLYNSFCGSSVLNNKTGFTLVSWDANDYDVRVHAFNFNSEGYYEVSVADSGLQPDDVGNTPASAAPLNPNGLDVNGVLQYTADVGTDEDWFQFPAVIGVYHVKLYSQAGRKDIAVYDLNDSGVLRLLASFYTSTTVDSNVAISHSGPCWLKASSPSSTGLYQVAVTAPVPVCGDANHQYPVGDFDHDCVVGFNDFAAFAAGWLADVRP
jgi:hypothetical protein